MLYVFFMNSGSFWGFDVKLGMESVSALSAEIERTHSIPISRQILIASGGERLLPERRVCTYNVGGTESNPIFLFDNQVDATMGHVDEAEDAETSNREYDLDVRVKDNLNLPAAFETVQKRMQLAKELDEFAQLEVSKCEALVREQLMLHQGWSAAVAHVDEFAGSLNSSYARFSELCVDLLSPEKREHFITMLSRFGSRGELLKRIPLASFLRERYLQADASPQQQVTLLELVSGEADQEQASLSELEQRARTLLDAVSRDGDEQIQEIAKAYNTLKKQLLLADLREIRGVSRRLREVQTVKEEVAQQAANVRTGSQAFAADFNRLRAAPASVRGGAEAQRGGVLAELCTSHCTLLPSLRDAAIRASNKRKLCARAKRELRNTICAAFGNLVGLHSRAAIFHRQLTLRSENLARLATLRSIVGQLDVAPRLYVATLTEVRRRKEAAAAYRRIWQAAQERLQAVYEPDMRIRMRFVSKLSAHFLKHVFNEYALERMLPEPSPVPADIDSTLPLFDDSDNETLESLRTLINNSADQSESPDLLQLETQDLADLQIACQLSEGEQQILSPLPVSRRDASTQTEEERAFMLPAETMTSFQQDNATVDKVTDVAALQRELESMRSQLESLQARMHVQKSNGQELVTAVSSLRRLVDECSACCEAVQNESPSESEPVAPALAGLDPEKSVFVLHEEEETQDRAKDERSLSPQCEVRKEEQLLVDCILAIRAFVFSAAVPVAHEVTSLLVGAVTQLAVRRLPELSPSDVSLASQLSQLVSLTRCVSGQLVLVYLNEVYSSYMLFSLMPILHFVHASSLTALGLPMLPSNASNRQQMSETGSESGNLDFAGTRRWAIAQVIKKELCVVKKQRNRFGLRLDSKFYHVRVQPLSVASIKQVLAHTGTEMHEVAKPEAAAFGGDAETDSEVLRRPHATSASSNDGEGIVTALATVVNETDLQPVGKANE